MTSITPSPRRARITWHLPRAVLECAFLAVLAGLRIFIVVRASRTLNWRERIKQMKINGWQVRQQWIMKYLLLSLELSLTHWLEFDPNTILVMTAASLFYSAEWVSQQSCLRRRIKAVRKSSKVEIPGRARREELLSRSKLKHAIIKFCKQNTVMLIIPREN